MNIYGISLKYDTLGYSVGFTTTTMTFPLDSTIETSPFVLKSADGLGAPNINISINNSLYSGGVYQNRKPELRQIVLRIGFQPDYSIGQTVADLRSQLYEWMTPKFGQPIKVSLLNAAGSTIAYTSAHGAKIEPNVFSKDPEVVLTLECESSYFKGPMTSVPSPGTLNKTSFSITNPGDAPSPFFMVFQFTAAASSVYLSDRMQSYLYILYAFTTGDVLTVNTIPGQRNMSIVRAGSTISMLPYQDSQSQWLQLFGGINYFTMNHSNYTFNAINIYPNYWGV